MAADIQKVLRRDLKHLAGSNQDERVEYHLAKAMENYEELRKVEKDHREMMDQFLSSAKEARTLLEPPPSVFSEPRDEQQVSFWTCCSDCCSATKCELVCSC